MFIENIGQFDDDARFHVRGGDYDLWLADDALWVTLLEAVQEEELREPFDPLAHLRENNPHPLSPLPLAEGLGVERAGMPVREGVNLKLSFINANPQPEIEPFNLLETMASTFWATTKTNGAPTYPFGVACATKISIRASTWN